MSWFICKVCAAKDELAAQLRSEIELLRSQLGHSRIREEQAVDRLLERRQERPITPPAKMEARDSEAANEQILSFFKDEDDKGDGKILEADRLDTAR